MLKAFENLWRWATPEFLAGLLAVVIVLAGLAIILYYIGGRLAETPQPTPYTGGPTALGTPSPGLTMGGFNFAALGSNVPSAPGAYGTPNISQMIDDYSDILPGGWRRWFVYHGMTVLRTTFFVISLALVIAALIPAGLYGGKFWALPILAIVIDVAHFTIWVRHTETGEQRVASFWGMLVFASPKEPAAQLGPFFAPFCSTELLPAKARQIVMIFGVGKSQDPGELNLASLQDTGIEPTVDREPILISWRAKRDEEGKETTTGSALEQELTTSPLLIVMEEIYDPIRFKIVVGSFKEGMHRLKAILIKSLQSVAGQNTVSMAISSINEISEKLLASAELLVGDPDAVARWQAENPDKTFKGARWGVNLMEVALATPGLTKTVNEGLAKRAATVLAGEGDATSTIRKGEADKRVKVLAGQAYKAAREDAATADSKYISDTGAAEAANLTAQADAIANNQGAAFIAGLRAWESGIKEAGNVTLLSGGGGNGAPAGMPSWVMDLAAVATAGANAQNSGGKKPGSGTPPTTPPASGTTTPPTTPPSGGGGGGKGRSRRNP